VDLVLRVLMVERPRDVSGKLMDEDDSVNTIEPQRGSSLASSKPATFRNPLPILTCLSDAQLVVA